MTNVGHMKLNINLVMLTVYGVTPIQNQEMLFSWRLRLIAQEHAGMCYIVQMKAAWCVQPPEKMSAIGEGTAVNQTI